MGIGSSELRHYHVFEDARRHKFLASKAARVCRFEVDPNNDPSSRVARFHTSCYVRFRSSRASELSALTISPVGLWDIRQRADSFMKSFSPLVSAPWNPSSNDCLEAHAETVCGAAESC